MTKYYPEFPLLSQQSQQVWFGYRPVTADGLPYIGRSTRYSNLILATGHAMLGMSLGPATGLIVSQIAQGVRSTIPLEIFLPERHMRW
jgi:D-amino-acid dehydrogenase